MVADGGYSVSIDQQTVLALDAFHAGRLQEAETLCRDILATDPGSFGARHLAGAVAAAKGDIPMAASHLREAVRLNPESPEAHGNLAEVLRRAGDLDGAAAQIAEALRLETRIQENYNRLGLVRIGQTRYEDAITCFRAALALNGTYADGWHNLGFALDRLSRVSEAVQAYDRALAIDPSRVDSWNNLGNARLKLSDPDGAIMAFRAALALQPDHRPALIGLATALDRNNDPQSIDILGQVASLSPDDVTVQAAYGEALFHLGRFDEANRIFESAIDRIGQKAELVYGLVQCRKMTAEDQPRIDAIVERLRSRDLSQSERGTLNYAAGKALDDIGQYSQAIAHFDEANRNWRVGRDFDRAAHSRTVDAMIASVDRETLDRLKSFADTSEVPIFVVGLPRSGTTLTEQLLARHPEIAAGGEVEFWLQQVDLLQFGLTRMNAFEQVADLASRYVTLLTRSAAGARRVVDKMPHNYGWLGLIHGLLPNARIIHCRRDPVDTCLSLYFTRFLSRHHFANDRADLVSYYRDYLRLMEHWRRLIPSDRLLEVDYESLVSGSEQAIRKIVEFCGLAWHADCTLPKSREANIRTASAWQARQPIYRSSVARWRNYEPWLGQLRELLPAAERETEQH